MFNERLYIWYNTATRLRPIFSVKTYQIESQA